MTLSARITALAQAIGQDIKALSSAAGGAAAGDVVMSTSPTRYAAPAYLPLTGGMYPRADYPALADMFPAMPMDAPTKLPDLVSPGTGTFAALSPNGDYLAVGVGVAGATSFLALYKRTGDTFTRLPNPAVLPPDRVVGLAWSPDSTHLVVQHFASPYLAFYKRSGDTFTKLANPTTIPGAMAAGAIAFSPDGAFLLVRASDTGPSCLLYARSGDTFTHAQTVGAYAGASSAAWSPDSNYFVIGTGGSTYYLLLYKRSGSTFTKVAELTSTASPYGLAFSGDGGMLYMAGSTAPYLYTYRRTGDTLTLVTGLVDTAPTAAPSTPGACATSPGGGYLAVALSASPFLLLYKIGDSGALTRLPNLAAPPPGVSRSVSFSQVGGYLAVSCPSNAPNVAIYKGDAANFVLPRLPTAIASVQPFIKT